jgi:hypothetical protein
MARILYWDEMDWLELLRMHGFIITSGWYIDLIYVSQLKFIFYYYLRNCMMIAKQSFSMVLNIQFLWY